MNVYRVVGSTGAYEDVMEWTAKVFKSLDEAEEFTKECQEYADSMMEPIEDEYGVEYPKYYQYDYHKDSPDMNISMDYTGTYYGIEVLKVH